MWASTLDLDTVAKAQTVQMWLASVLAVRICITQIAICASTWGCGTYRIVECRRLRRACANMQTRQSLHFSHKWHSNSEHEIWVTLLISYFYITKSILISQTALDFVISQIWFCDIKNRICDSKNQAHFVISKNRFCDFKQIWYRKYWFNL